MRNARRLFVSAGILLVLCGTLVAQTTDTSGSTTRTTTTTTLLIPRPDLMLEGPVISDSPNNDYLTHIWTVKNVGTADAPASQLLFKCSILYAASAYTRCKLTIPEAMTGTATLPVPPLQKGASYTCPYRVVANIDAKIPYGEAEPPLHRIQLTTTADGLGQVTESNEVNNKWELLIENFQGPPPSQAIMPASIPGPAPQPQPVVSTPINLNLLPQMSIYTDVPWTPASPVWIMVKNTGASSSAAVTVEFTCSWIVGGQVQSDSCSDWFVNIPASQPVATMTAGQFKALYQLKPGSKQGSSGWVPGTYMLANYDYDYQLRFHVVGANATDLVLTKQ